VYLVPNQLLRGYTDTLGGVLCATAISAQLGENATQFQTPATVVHGSVYLLPKPVPLVRGYAWIRGGNVKLIAISAQLGENTTQVASLKGGRGTHGLLYLVPKPVPLVRG
jgi:hypothetical protein